jgi:hypothetical protein
LVQLHNFPGRVKNIGVQANPIPKAARVEFVPEWRCPTSDCSRWIHMEFPLRDVERSGWMPFLFKVNAFMADGSHWHTLTGWQANVQNGKPPLGTGTPWLRVRGDTWLENTTPGGSKYSTANIDKAEFPWNATTGEPIPKSGIWRPTVFFQGKKFGQVLIDPALHANPPNLGWEVYKGPYLWRTLTIDTTRLTNGKHRMLLISCHNHDSGRENCGVLAVPFIVQNKTWGPYYPS